MWEPWKKLAHVLSEVLAHSVGAAAIILILLGMDVGSEYVPQLDRLAWLVGTPYVFTVHDLLHWADLGTIVAFLGIGLVRICLGLLR